MTSISAIPIQTEDGLRLSALNPKYLHTNSTSHTWPFSAIAELIDNAYDPDVNASQLWIDLKTFKSTLALTFTDNGNGMMPDKLYKMLSFGFCEKVAIKGHQPVGHYGNGFKSGSMRLGKDALVFTKRPDTWSLGFLSQTYLAAIKSETIVVPIVVWDAKMFTMLNKEEGGELALNAILEHSVVNTEQQIKEEFRCIPGQWGTRIVIFNLRKTADNRTEFDFTSDPHDIRIPDDAANSDECRYKREQRQDHIPASDYSLRAYCSILYLKPKMQIILRGKKVKTCVIAKSLSKTEVDAYRPAGATKPVKIVFGFSQNKNHYGIMMYHRNRLIKPYVRVGHQLKANILGVGVIGVIECDFLQPTHNKQDFDYTKAYRACMASLGQKLNEYWQEKKGPSKKMPQEEQESGFTLNDDDEIEKIPDELWVQCDNPKCLKWRRLPDGANPDSLPDKWFCYDHPDPVYRSCEVPEEPYWEEEEILKPYKKEVKRKLEKEKEREKEIRRMKEEKEKERKAAELAAKYDRELEAEKKKRLDSELKLKEHQEEIKRLQEQLKKEKEEKEILNSVASVSFPNIPSPPSSQQMLTSPQDLGIQGDLHIQGNIKGDGQPRAHRSPNLLESSPLTSQKSGSKQQGLAKPAIPSTLDLQGGMVMNDVMTPQSGVGPHGSLSMSPQGGIASHSGLSSHGGMSPISPNLMPPQPGGGINSRLQGSGFPGGMNSLPPHIQRVSNMNSSPVPTKPPMSNLPMSPVVGGVGQSLLGSPLNPAMTPPPMTPPGINPQANPPFMRNPSLAKVETQLAQIGVSSAPKANRTPKSSSHVGQGRPQAQAGRTPNKRTVNNDMGDLDSLPSKAIKKEEVTTGLSLVSPGMTLMQSIPQNLLKSIDEDITGELEAKPRDSLVSVLLKRSQQLRDLRTSVCKLLSVLVPDLNLPDLRGRPVDDDTIDGLLKQVLEANKDGN